MTVGISSAFSSQPANTISDGGSLLKTTLTSTSPVTSKTILCGSRALGVVFTLSASTDGSFYIKHIDSSGVVRVLRDTTAYTATTLVRLPYAYFVRAAYVVFTPASAPCTVSIDAFSIGSVSPISAAELSSKAYVDLQNNRQVTKGPVRVKSQGVNITRAGEQTIDGVSLSDGDLVLLTDQTIASQNGLWTVRTGTWERPENFSSTLQVSGSLISVMEGSDAGALYMCTTAPNVDFVDIDDLTFDPVSGGGGGGAPDPHAASHLPSGSDPLATAAASALSPGNAGAEGVAESFARSDHIHSLPAFGTSAGTFAEGNHTHTFTPLRVLVTDNGTGVLAIKDGFRYSYSAGVVSSLISLSEGGSADFSAYSYGSGGSGVVFYRAGGTEASPTSISSGTVLGSLAFYGYHGSNYGLGAYLHATARETWSGTAYGTILTLQLVPASSTTLQPVAVLSTDAIDFAAPYLTLSSSSTAAQIATAFYGKASYPILAGQRSRGSLGSPSAVQSGDTLLSVSAHGYGTSAFNFLSGSLLFQATENWTNSAAGTSLTVSLTTTGTTSLTTPVSFYSNRLVVNSPAILAVNSNSTQAPFVLAAQTGNAPIAPPTNTLGLLIGANSVTNIFLLEAYSSTNNATGPFDLLFRRSDGTRASPSQTASGDHLGRISFQGYHSSASWTGSVVQIVATTTQAFTTSAQGSALIFRVTPNNVSSGTLTDYFTLAGAGRSSSTGSINLSPASQVSGQNPLVVFNLPSESALSLTATQNVPDVDFNLARTKRHAGGAIAFQSDFRIRGATHTAVSASAVTAVTTLWVEVPVASTNFNVNAEGIFAIYTGGRVFVGSGAEASPGLVLGFNQTGIYTTASTLMAFSLAGNRRMYIDNSVSALILDNGYAVRSGTSASTPNFSFGTDTTTGLQYVTTSVFGVKTNNIMRMQYHADGNISMPGSLVIGAAVGTTPSYVLEVQGTVGYSSAKYETAQVAKTFSDSPYTVVSSDLAIYYDCSSGASTVNLPAAVAGRVIEITKTDSSANSLTIVPNGAETIAGATSIIMAVAFSTITLKARAGIGWIIT